MTAPSPALARILARCRANVPVVPDCALCGAKLDTGFHDEIHDAAGTMTLLCNDCGLKRMEKWAALARAEARETPLRKRRTA